MLGLDVNRGQDGARAHAAQQVDAGCAAAGANLHDRSRTDRCGHEAQRCAGQRANRCRPAYLGGVPPGADERVVLGQEIIDVGESVGTRMEMCTSPFGPAVLVYGRGRAARDATPLARRPWSVRPPSLAAGTVVRELTEGHS